MLTYLPLENFYLSIMHISDLGIKENIQLSSNGFRLGFYVNYRDSDPVIYKKGAN